MARYQKVYETDAGNLITFAGRRGARSVQFDRIGIVRDGEDELFAAVEREWIVLPFSMARHLLTGGAWKAVN